MIHEQFTLIYVHTKVAQKGLKMAICTIFTIEKCRFIAVPNSKIEPLQLRFHHADVTSPQHSVDMVHEQFNLTHVHTKVAQKGLKMVICTICTIEKLRYIAVKNQTIGPLQPQISSFGC